ncbi:hypothetical protein ACFVT5_02150 [Streptomyces sp. NPDC058001]|uniref:hypothetical protein n=1 Tax=Streptomyces sp. NPDC058001 TaxID=3346300 RepID=UPI0036E44D2B
MSPDRTGEKEKRKLREPREREGERRNDGPLPRRKEQVNPAWERERERLEKDPDAAAKKRAQQREKMQELRRNRRDAEAGRKEQQQHQEREPATADTPSLWPEIAALEVYENYRQRMAGWPEMPPVGLRVALHPETVGHGQQEATVVRLEAPQPAHGPSGSSVPPFLADPSLDLTDGHLQHRAVAAGVRAQDYGAAMRMQNGLLEAFRAEEFGQDVAQPSPYAGPSADAHSSDAGWAYRSPEPMFDGVDVDALLATTSVNYGAFDTAGLSSGPGPAPVNPAAPYLAGGMYGADALPQGMQGLTVTAPSYSRDPNATFRRPTPAAQLAWTTSPQGRSPQRPAR